MGIALMLEGMPYGIAEQNTRNRPYLCKQTIGARYVHFVSYKQGHVYDTIHHAPATTATRTIIVKMLAPALSPVVTALNVTGV